MTDEEVSNYTQVTKQIKSPIMFFVLVALLSNTIISIGAAVTKDSQVFIYCIHMFLAIIGVFFMIVLWSPRSLYHPRELKDIDKDRLPPYRPWIPTVISIVFILIYVVNHYILAILGVWPKHIRP